MAKHMLLMTGNFANWEKLPENEKSSIMLKYENFVRMLNEKKCFVGGDPATSGQILLQEDAANPGLIRQHKIEKNTDANITGYFIIETATSEEAVALAAFCPAFTHQDRVQVIPLGYD